MNALFVVKKPLFVSSNSYLGVIKRKYKNKKAGFSGTLDPFAKGCLIVAFGQYSKLFQFLDKTPKTYRATLWLGTTSDSLDIENIFDITHPNDMKTLDTKLIEKYLEELKGEIEYIPPKYSAKKVDGKRAYALARNGKEVELKASVMTIYDSKFISYKHPFITFDVDVSEGSYIRSYAQLLCEKLEVQGTLSYLERINEGKFFYENEKKLNPIEYLNYPINKYFGDKSFFINGKKMGNENFSIKDDGKYIILFDDFFSIIEIKDEKIIYLLNRMNFENTNN